MFIFLFIFLPCSGGIDFLSGRGFCFEAFESYNPVYRNIGNKPSDGYILGYRYRRSLLGDVGRFLRVVID